MVCLLPHFSNSPTIRHAGMCELGAECREGTDCESWLMISCVSPSCRKKAGPPTLWSSCCPTCGMGFQMSQVCRRQNHQERYVPALLLALHPHVPVWTGWPAVWGFDLVECTCSIPFCWTEWSSSFSIFWSGVDGICGPWWCLLLAGLSSSHQSLLF